ncbi:CIPK26, partial [Symbiodinium sp. KB8]
MPKRVSAKGRSRRLVAPLQWVRGASWRLRGAARRGLSRSRWRRMPVPGRIVSLPVAARGSASEQGASPRKLLRFATPRLEATASELAAACGGDDPYEIGKTLGEGTFGKVKWAVDTETNQKVAIKILDKEKIQRQNMGAQIKKEISIMKMVRHPNVVKLHEVLASRTKIFIVLEL